jgi:DNA-binding XRE family transcriptional regulator
MGNQTIEYEQEEDGRWIAELPQFPGLMAYGTTAAEARTRVLALLSALSKNDEERLDTVEEAFGPREPGRMIRGYRSREGLTQAELAKRLGSTRSVVSGLETGRRPVSAKMARRLAEVFNSSPLMFLAISPGIPGNRSAS